MPGRALHFQRDEGRSFPYVSREISGEVVSRVGLEPTTG